MVQIGGISLRFMVVVEVRMKVRVRLGGVPEYDQDAARKHHCCCQN